MKEMNQKKNKSDMQKIVIITSTLKMGGAEIQTVELANSLRAKGLDIVLVSLDPVTEVKERVKEGIPVHILNKRKFLDLQMFKRLLGIIRAFKPHGMIMVNSYATMYGYFARIFSGQRIKMVTVQHTTLVTAFIDRMENHFYRRIFNRMAHVVFVCNAQKEHWVKEYGIKPAISRVVYNGIDLDRFLNFRKDAQEVKKDLGFGSEDIVIGISANFRPEKKHEDLLEAAAILLEKGYPIKVLFVGDGVRRPYIEEYIHKKGLDEIVRITGLVSDVRPYLAAMDIVLLTSVAVETLSIAIIEAMAMARPVVLSDIGGARELVDHGSNGFIYEAGSIPQLSEAIRHIIDNRLYDEMGARSREKAIRHFGREAMVKGYMDILGA